MFSTVYLQNSASIQPRTSQPAENEPLRVCQKLAKFKVRIKVRKNIGYLYVTGGEGNAGILNTVERYDPSSNTWVAVAPMRKARCGHGSAVLDGFLYVVGGEGVRGDEFCSVERYNPSMNLWEAMAPMSATDMGEISDLQIIAALGGKLYVADGDLMDEEDEPAPLLRFDPESNTWAHVSTMINVRDTMADSFTSFVLDGKLYVTGGGTLGGISEACPWERYDPSTNEWEETPLLFGSNEVLRVFCDD